MESLDGEMIAIMNFAFLTDLIMPADEYNYFGILD